MPFAIGIRLWFKYSVCKEMFLTPFPLFNKAPREAWYDFNFFWKARRRPASQSLRHGVDNLTRDSFATLLSTLGLNEGTLWPLLIISETWVPGLCPLEVRQQTILFSPGGRGGGKRFLKSSASRTTCRPRGPINMCT